MIVMPRITLYFFTYLIAYGGILIASVIHIISGGDELPEGMLREMGGPAVFRNSDGLIPTDLVQAVLVVDENLGEIAKEKVALYVRSREDRNSTDGGVGDASEYEGFGHHGLGTQLRNEWGLWHDTRLKRWFLWHGFLNADAMSATTLREFVRHRETGRINSYRGRRFSIVAAVAFPTAVLLILVRSLMGRFLGMTAGRNGQDN